MTSIGTFAYLSIFSNADAKAKGFPEISAPVLSAPNSLVLEIAILMIIEATGAAIIAMTITAGCVFLFLLPPPQKTILDINEMAAANIAAMLETKISLFFICDNSCARTPSNSSLFKSFKIPVVTATFAFFGFLPVANAFG